MSFDDLSASLASDDRPSAEVVEIELDVELLRSVVQTESEEVPEDDAQLLELLARLDSADTVASGVEAKLDGILGTLDDLLARLEPKDSEEATKPLSKPPSEQPSPEQA